MEAKTVVMQDGLKGKKYKYNQNYVECKKCKGTGKGSGAMEQGGFVRGVCSKCNGYGGWLKIDYSSKRAV